MLRIHVLATALGCGLLVGAASSISARAQNSAPANSASIPQDRHEGLVLSADAYADAGRAKEKFGKANPYPVGILPVEVFLQNETNQAIKIDLNTVQLTVHSQGGQSQDVSWLTPQEVATAIAHPKGPAAPHAPRLPTIGIPTGADNKADKLVAILQPLTLDADVVPPQAVIHGFLFFDVNRDFSIIARSSIYLPDASTIPANKPLMFFEVPLARSEAH